MRDYFNVLSDRLIAARENGEVVLLNLSGEESDFVRFNRSRVRQAGTVRQFHLNIELIRGRRHAGGAFTLSGDADADLHRGRDCLADLRAALPQVEEDPFLLYAQEVRNSLKTGEHRLAPTADIVDDILSAGRDRDLVGLYAAGPVYAGFANSYGQKNWFVSCSYNMEWCLYADGDTAVKSACGGVEWDTAGFVSKVESAGEKLAVLRRPPVALEPGEYRVFLSPHALAEIAGMISTGFGLKECRTKNTCLLKMLEGRQRLSPAVAVCENNAGGLGPDFTAKGFIVPDSIQLVSDGTLTGNLVSSRSAAEYGETPNAGSEMPAALELAPGDIPDSEIFKRLDTGIYIGRLWYLNFSDVPACRITGMTRFDVFHVEHGEIRAPVKVMRFDETAYRVLGRNLQGLTANREFIPSTDTYLCRKTDSMTMPGALVDDFRLTL